ncbi:MAG TPA: MBL fold metallo-hydrolase [Steroidobacteraceae bacterium]|nr:MBL fold metallo-hydrolase [Steroidobacteraceae bacterium]
MVWLLAAAGVVLAACSRKEEAPPAAASEAPAAAAETQAPAPSANVKDFMIGELSALALRDGTLEFPNDNQIFGIGRKAEDVSALLTPAGLPTDKIQLDLDPLLVRTTDRVLLFDTGAGSNFGPGAGKLPNSLAEAGVDAQAVTDIFISHVHGDHVGGIANAQGAPTFPNAKIHISRPEWKFLTGLGAEKAKGIGVQNYDALIAAMKPMIEDFAPNAELIPGVVTAVEIKGHTPGHSGYRIQSGTDSLLYIGDAMHHYILSVQKPDWPMSFDSDQAAGAKSRTSLLAELAQSGQRVYAVHFPFPGLGKFEKQGEGYVWVAE